MPSESILDEVKNEKMKKTVFCERPNISGSKNANIGICVAVFDPFKT